MSSLFRTVTREVPITELFALREQIDLDPPYQRQGDVWRLAERRLLIDSILNRFDIPKIYFHRFSEPRPNDDAEPLVAAVIDGKQRLQAIWQFMDGRLRLDRDFVLLEDESVDAARMSFAEMTHEYPQLRAEMLATTLTVVDVWTEDEELLEDMFTRLNTAATLNAAEKRNALGGAMPPILRQLARHDFFTSRVNFDTTRYADRDMAAKFVAISSSGSFASTKKNDLDSLVLSYRPRRRFSTASARRSSLQAWRSEKRSAERGARELRRTVSEVLDRMAAYFGKEDTLLTRKGDVLLFYHLFRLLGDRQPPRGFTRSRIASFFEDIAGVRTKQARLAEGGRGTLSRREQLLAEFLRHSQSLNDGYAQLSRYQVMATDFEGEHNVILPSPEPTD